MRGGQRAIEECNLACDDKRPLQTLSMTEEAGEGRPSRKWSRSREAGASPQIQSGGPWATR